MTAIAAAGRPPKRPQKFDAPQSVRMGLAIVGGGLSALALYAVVRGLLGIVQPMPGLRETAVAVHLATVIPALPLGAYVLLRRKGGPAHRLLGRIWLALMFATAVSTIFIRHINNGQFSWIHLFTLLTFITVPRAILMARRGRIDDHRNTMLGFYTGALLIAGLFSFLPGRLMWHLAFN